MSIEDLQPVTEQVSHAQAIREFYRFVPSESEEKANGQSGSSEGVYGSSHDGDSSPECASSPEASSLNVPETLEKFFALAPQPHTSAQTRDSLSAPPTRPAQSSAATPPVPPPRARTPSQKTTIILDSVASHASTVRAIHCCSQRL